MGMHQKLQDHQPWSARGTNVLTKVQNPKQDGRKYAKAEALEHESKPTNDFSGDVALLTIGLKNRSWNGRMHDQRTVLAIDRSIFSIGAIHSWLPVSSRKRIALRRSRTGWYVSGTNKTIRRS